MENITGLPTNNTITLPVFAQNTPSVFPEVPQGRVLVRRAYEYCNVEIELPINGYASAEQINEVRKQAAKLVDEGIRELKLTLSAEKEKESLFREAIKLERIVADFPKTEDGLFDPNKLKPEEKKTAKRYREIMDLLKITVLYDYSDLTDSYLSKEND